MVWTCVPAAFADDMVPVQPQNNSTPTAVQQPAAPAEALTLDTVWQLVETNHPELAQAALKQRIAEANLLEKQGAFDPRLTADPFYQRYNTSSSRGKTGEGYGVDSAVEILTRSGAKLFAGAAWNDGLIKSPASSTGEAGTYSVGLDIPLLRGGWGRNEKAFAERAARIKIPLSGADVQAKRLELLGKSAKAYWSWWAASQKVLVGREVLTLAQVRRGQVQQLANAGDVPAIDAVEADLAVQQRLGALAGYEQELTTAALDLLYFLWTSPEQPVTAPPTAVQVPMLTNLPPIPDDTALAEQLVNALRNLPQFAQIRFQKDLVSLDQALAQNLRLPELNVYLKPGADLGKQSVGPVLTAGISIMVPLRNRTADGRLAAARWSLSQLDSVQRQQVQQVVIGVQQSVIAARQALAQWEAARQEVDRATRMETGERERYRLGDSTLFLVNSREQTTASARLKVIESEKNYRLALNGLSLQTNQPIGP